VAAAVPPTRRHAALGAIDALLAQALTLDGARYATPYNFVRALRRRAISVAAPTQPNAVQLMTIHGAKGLEARVVFVMDSDPEPKTSDTAVLLIDWPVESAHPLRCAFVYAESQCPPSLASVLARERAARQREELNGLYVAMSRAKERLVLSATEPHRPGVGRSWWQRVEARATAWTVPPQAPGHVAAGGDSVTLRCLPRWQGGVAIDARPAPPDPLSDEASRLGQAVHRVLEWAARGTNADAVSLSELGAAAAREFAVDAAEVDRLTRRIWTSPDCARFFGGAALRWAGNEVPVSESGEVLRIDRLVALEESGERTWWVLDYKLRHASESLGEYREQMRRYRDAVRRLQPGDAVRCAFITGAGEVIEVP
jgi:ATP-dependent helicase/nuclease subunit A